MSDTDLREQLNQFWLDTDRAAQQRKDSQSAILALQDLYTSLSEHEKLVADQVIVEWAVSDDTRKRYDGLALINRFGIRSALPALRQLADRFEKADGPSSPYDWAKVNRLIGRLDSRDESLE